MEEQKQTLTKKQRKLLQAGVIILLALFLAGFFLFQKLNTKKPEEPKLKNTTVYLQDTKLQVFDDSYSVNVPYPDKINVHYPYLLIVKPTQQITYIYNLDQKKKGKEVKQILLDYLDGNQLYSKGNTTFYNDTDLGIVCEKGFIESTAKAWCITKSSKDGSPNMLTMINLKTYKNAGMDTSLTGFYTDLKVIDGKMYVGEIDTHTNKSRILIDKKPIDVPNIVSLIYEMNQKPYLASFKSELNNNIESYYLIEDDKVIKQEDSKIYIYR